MHLCTGLILFFSGFCFAHGKHLDFSSFTKRQVDVQPEIDDGEFVGTVILDEHLSHKIVSIFDFNLSNTRNEHISFDGWYHDLTVFSTGSKGGPIKNARQFEVRNSQNLPNVFQLSETLLKDDSIHYSRNGKNLLSVYFGMFILNEILDSSEPSCPPSYHKVEFPRVYLGRNGEEVDYLTPTKHSFMYLNKVQHCKQMDTSNMWNKVNMRSAWVDGEIIYGNSKFCSDKLRTFIGGKLIDFTELGYKESSNLYLIECFKNFGNDQINQNPFVLSIHVIWLRWHNLIAEMIQDNHAEMCDQAIFVEARKYTIATLQHIVFDEWLPHFLGSKLPRYGGYSKDIDPHVNDLFDASAKLYVFSLVTPFVFKLSSECTKDVRYTLVRMCNSCDQPHHYLYGKGFDKILAGLLMQSAQRDDHYITDDVRIFAKGPRDFTRQDNVAIHIQQNRYFSLLDYLSSRKFLNLDQNSTYSSFEQLAQVNWPFLSRIDFKLISKLKKLYNNDVNAIDMSIGALLEADGESAGPVITKLFLDHFVRIRDGDRFYFENHLNGLFTETQVKKIKELKFSEIIKLASRVNNAMIQPNAFFLPKANQNKIADNCLHEDLFQAYLCKDLENGKFTAQCYTLAYKKDIQLLEKCTDGQTYDFFLGSELSFILTIMFLFAFVLCVILLLKLLVNIKVKRNERFRLKVSKLRRMTISDNATLSQEWIGPNEAYRNVQVILNSKGKSVKVKLEYDNRVVRCIYLKGVVGKVKVECSSNKAQNHALVRVPKEYDLVLKFDSYYDREKFITKLESFLAECNISLERSLRELDSILKFAYTKSKRQKHLEQFFRVIFSHAFNKKTSENIDVKTAKEIIETELTQFEFAEVLSMRPDSTFVQQMFSLIDKDNNGYISFREFLDVIIIFAKGSAEQKIKIMFDMYDVNQTGRLSISDFKVMIKSLLEIANQSISSIEMDQTIHSMLMEIGFTSKKELSFEDFNKLFNNYKDELGFFELNFDLSNMDKIKTFKSRQSALIRANDTIVRAYSYFGGNSGPDFASFGKPSTTLLKIETQEHLQEPDWIISWIRFIDTKKREIFCVALYTLIVIVVFLDKAFYYNYLNESSGLRQITGLGVCITRGSASVLMLTFSTILLTMCRNLITVLRETFLHQYIPFDAAVTFHKYIAILAFVMSIVHAVGHICNFYHISTQRSSDLNCLFRETYFLHGETPKFHHWCFQTLTGLTGISLLCLLFVIYIFAMQYSRRHVFNTFWLTHSLYPLFYILIVLHGLGQLIQPPIFYFYILLPITLFTVDRLISASRKRIEISVVRATLHPSDVTHLEFKKPPNFDYKSGQWVRIACLGLNGNEYHPFTISSAPHEDTLSLYIRAVGPFTKNLRQIYDHNLLNGRPYAKLYLDGPYGEGHQDWFKFDVSVLVGGGIGITPFASIIKDITFKSSINAKINCKKVYFLWVTRTQKHFEWMSDVIREAESKDRNNLLVTHIFITQFYEKFDLRTTMLYICERHFQRISNKSLFTGLRAKTHFGRPNFSAFLDSLQQEHPEVERVGVFSCGPNPMTHNVQQACENLNRREGAIFIHHFENF